MPRASPASPGRLGIHGNHQSGAGILDNQVYSGKLVASRLVVTICATGAPSGGYRRSSVMETGPGERYPAGLVLQILIVQ